MSTAPEPTADRPSRYGREGTFGRLSDRGRRRVEYGGALLAVVVGGVLVLGPDTGPVLQVGGAGLAVWGALAGAARWIRPRRPVPQLVAGALDGRPATLLHRDPVGPALDLLALAVLAVPAFTWAAMALPAGGAAAALAAVLAGVGLACLAPGVLAMLGRYDLGVTAFTPTHLEYRSMGLRSRVAWDDISWAIDLPDRGLVHVEVEAHAARPHRGTVPAALRGEPRPVPGVVTVPGTRFAGERAPFTVAELARMVQHLHTRPELHSALGTPRGPEHLAHLARMPHGHET